MRAAALIVLGILVAPAAHAFEAFLGTYVGSAELEDMETGIVQQRDVSTVIEPYGDGGFAVGWTTVIRVDGRRDVPGVRRVERRLAFQPVENGAYYLQVPDFDPFRVREALAPMEGDALAWASLEGGTLDIWVAALTNGAEGELQLHRRVLDEAGLTLDYLSFVGGIVSAKGRGRMVKVE